MRRAAAWLTGTSLAAERAMREAAISTAPGCPESIIRDANRRYAEQLRAISSCIGTMVGRTSRMHELLRRMENHL